MRKKSRGVTKMDKLSMKLSASLLTGLAASFWGVYGPVMCCVLIAIIMDIITGLVKAKALGIAWSSKVGARGFWKKMALITALAFGIFLDAFVPIMLGVATVELPFKLPIGTIVGCYIVLNECISIFENIYAVNPVALPKWIKTILEGAKEDINEPTKRES